MKEQAGLSPSTIYSYTGCRKRVAPYFGHIHLNQLTPAAINKAYSDMLSTGVSKATVYQYHLFIHSMLAMAFKENLIPRNYASAAMPPKRDVKEVQALNEDEINAFFTALYGDSKHYMYQVLFSLMLATGCRIGEICALTWDNIDFDANRIHICRHFGCSKSGSQIMDGCKTNAGDRWLTMDTGIMDILKEYHAYYLKRVERFGSKWNYEANAVFFAEHRYGACINPDTVRYFLQNFTKKHGLPHIHPHMFRHTAVSLELQAGISIADAAKRAGHARPVVDQSADPTDENARKHRNFATRVEISRLMCYKAAVPPSMDLKLSEEPTAAKKHFSQLAFCVIMCYNKHT
ncbi:MAG: site-specific integrase [Oscillospiraceae bacterium]|nr:site-specific integrase [Oscillospiraceae bacterium]